MIARYPTKLLESYEVDITSVVVRIPLGIGSAFFLFMSGVIMAEKLTALGYAVLYCGVFLLIMGGNR